MKKFIAAAALLSTLAATSLLPANGVPEPEQGLPATLRSQNRPLVGTQEATSYSWPSGQEVPVLRAFSPGRANWNAGHRGVDLALAEGDSVYAAGDGTIIFAGKLNDRMLVSIQHSDGIRTTYEPIIPAVERNQQVVSGQLIGTVDGTHCAPFSCLHWGAKVGADGYINPLSLLTLELIRLYE